MAQLVTREELALVLDEVISAERFDALYASAGRVVQAGFDGDIDTVTGRAAAIVGGVLTSVMARILSNPKGARQLNAGGAGITFGGADDEITKVFSLNDDERADLAYAASIVDGQPGSGGAFTIRPF